MGSADARCLPDAISQARVDAGDVGYPFAVVPPLEAGKWGRAKHAIKLAYSRADDHAGGESMGDI